MQKVQNKGAVITVLQVRKGYISPASDVQELRCCIQTLSPARDSNSQSASHPVDIIESPLEIRSSPAVDFSPLIFTY